MLKPMNGEQIDKLANEYWMWFSETPQYHNQPFLEKLKSEIKKDEKLKDLFIEISKKIFEDDLESQLNRDKILQLSPLEETIKFLEKKPNKKVRTAMDENEDVKVAITSLYGTEKIKKIKEKLKVKYPIEKKVKEVYKELALHHGFGDVKSLSPLEKTLKKLLVLESDSLTKLELLNKLKEVGIIKKEPDTDDEYIFIRKKMYDKLRGSLFVREKLFKYFNVCPYCNYTYLSNLEGKSNGKDYYALELDHYYPKSKYPYLALTIFNLVPSCHICNGIKGDKEGHLYPYEENSNKEVKFKFSGESIEVFVGIYTNSIQSHLFSYDETKICVELEVVNPESEIGKRAKVSKNIFKLKEKYSDLKEEMKDLYFKYLSSSKSQVDELLNFKELNLTEEQIKEIYYGVKTKPEEYHKRPLSKFINDLIDDLEKRY